MTDAPLQNMPNIPEPQKPGLLAYASVPAGVVLGWSISHSLLKNQGNFLRNGVSLAGALGLGYLAASTFLKPAQSPFPVPPIQTLAAFPGISTSVPPSPQTYDAFMRYAMDIAGRASLYAPDAPTSPLNAIVNNLAEKGLTEQAAALRNHLMAHGTRNRFYTALDAWLEEMARTRPETAQHIARQSVLLAMTIDANTQHLPPEAREKLFVQATFAGMLHDIGKLAIAPELLDKSSRISRHEMNRVLHAYQAAIPDYPEKKDDMKFLEMANGGRVFFAKNPPQDATPIDVKEYLQRIENQPLAGEPGFADDVMKVSAEQIYARIQRHAAERNIMLFTPQEEEALLNRSRRGTLSEQEGAIMASHDQLGVLMLQSIGIPKEIEINPSVINMERGVMIDNPAQAQLREWIMLSDIAEAVTGQRAYNRENGKNLTPNEALQVLAREAEHGMMKPETVQQFAASGVMQRYAALYPDIPTQRTAPAPQIQAASVQHAREISPDMVAAL